jgi:hypothetical protein
VLPGQLRHRYPGFPIIENRHEGDSVNRDFFIGLSPDLR